MSLATACSSHKDTDEGSSTEEDGGASAGRASSGRGGSGGRTGSGSAGRASAGRGGNSGDGDNDGDNDGESGPKAGSGGSKSPTNPGNPGDDEDAGVPDEPGSLRKAADSAKKIIGAGVESDPIQMDADYKRVATTEFSALSPQSTLRWNVLAAKRGEWWYDPTDKIIAAAAETKQQVRGSPLIGWATAPEWATALTPQELPIEVERHIRTAVAHFKGKIAVWGVIGDALDDATLQLRPGIYTTLGVPGLAQIFKLVKEVDPDAKLYYDDFGIDIEGPKLDAVLKLVEDLKAAGATIDGIGIQSHLSTGGYLLESKYRAAAKKIAAAVPAFVYSELDVQAAAGDPTGDAASRGAAQRLVYQLISGICGSEEKCAGVTVWGVTDKLTSIPNDSPLVFDASYKSKPAYDGLIDGLSGRLPKLGGDEIIQNGDFGTLDFGWNAFGGGALAVQGTTARSGNAAALSGRLNTYEGLGQSVLGKLKREAGVCISAQVRVDVAAAPVTATLKIDPGTTPEAVIYQTIGTATASTTDWTELTGCGAATVPDKAVDATLYISGPPAGTTIFADDISLKRLTPN